VYAAAGKRDQKNKYAIATGLIGEEPFAVSTQVLAEFYTNVTRKGLLPMSRLEALDWVERFAEQICVPVDITLVRNGIRLSERYRISYWDGAIVAAAEAAGADTLYTEDLNHGQLYGSVRALNPFI
jgi:predicted nucleic acid-binding protein